MNHAVESVYTIINIQTKLNIIAENYSYLIHHEITTNPTIIITTLKIITGFS